MRSGGGPRALTGGLRSPLFERKALPMAVKDVLPRKVQLDRNGATLTLTAAVRILRHHRLIRVTMVALLMVSWISFTNHCALGMMRPRAQAATKSEPCCGGKTSPRHDLPSSLRDCCNIKVITAAAKTEVRFDASQFQLQLHVVLQTVAPRAAKRPPTLIFDHGPPRSISFAEAVLQRGLLSRAPPFAG